MPFRNKRRYLKKKYQIKKDIDKDAESNEDKQEPLENQIGDLDGDIKKSLHQKRKFLEILEKTTSQLKSDTNNKLYKLLEDLLAITDRSSERRTLLFQLLSMFFTYFLHCDEGEIYKLKVSLSSKHSPKELKDLVVDDDALIVTSFFPMGIGRFGILREGILKKSKRRTVPVVIKEPLNCEFDQHILAEAKVLSQFHHDHVIKILAFQKRDTGPRFAIERMPLGNLEDALQEFDFTDQKLLIILKEVAEGMRYIAKKKYVHRDLVCKKVLLDSQATCKISGFSLCRYVGDTGGICEDKDMDVEGLYVAPESRKTNQFTTKTDMWAMGLLSWETLYMACCSLRRDSFVPRNVLKLQWLRIFASKGMLPNPGRCSPFLWRYVVQALLNNDPEKRPAFAELRKQLDKYDGRLF